MINNIRLLDCTLRDGGHLNQGKFGKDVIKAVIKRLVDAKIDIIEVGFLWNQKCEEDVARYYTIKDVKQILPKNSGESKFSLMADYIDLKHLEPYDGTIEYIRLSFKRQRLDWALETARILMDKGYKCFINPVNCNVYTDEQYLEVLKKVNDLNPYGFSIVDTFGVMRKHDLSRMYYLIDNNLDSDITIGLHLHENLGLAYSLAQHYIEIHNSRRNIVIDGSLLGMGRVPGNLCIEQIMDHLNVNYGAHYMTEPALDAIDDYIAPIKEQIPWGYSIPYALSAKYNLHRTYAEYLMNKRRLKTKDIQRILCKIDRSEAELFNEAYVEQLYKEYVDVEIDDTEAFQRLKKDLRIYEKIIVVAPGATLIENQDIILQCAKEEKSCVIGINFVPNFIKPTYVFCTNLKRIDSIDAEKCTMGIIVTSNLMEEIVNCEYVMSYHELTAFGDVYNDDSTLMMLNLLKKCDIKALSLAGFDGFTNRANNFCSPLLERNHQYANNKQAIKRILNNYFQDMQIEFLTPSIYVEDSAKIEQN